jgi:hypothetical protein
MGVRREDYLVPEKADKILLEIEGRVNSNKPKKQGSIITDTLKNSSATRGARSGFMALEEVRRMLSHNLVSERYQIIDRDLLIKERDAVGN